MMSVASLQHSLDGMVAVADDKLARLSTGHIGLGEARVQSIALDHIGDVCGGEDALRVAIGMTLCLKPNLKMLILLSQETRTALAHAVMGAAGTDAALADSLLAEMGNILGSCVANAVADMLGHGVTTSTPEVAVDLAGAVLACALAHMDHVAESVLLLDLSVTLDAVPTDCRIVLLFDADAGRLLLQGPDGHASGRLLS